MKTSKLVAVATVSALTLSLLTFSQHKPSSDSAVTSKDSASSSAEVTNASATDESGQTTSSDQNPEIGLVKLEQP